MSHILGFGITAIVDLFFFVYVSIGDWKFYCISAERDVRFKEYSPWFESGLNQTQGSSHESTQPEGGLEPGRRSGLLSQTCFMALHDRILK